VLLRRRQLTGLLLRGRQLKVGGWALYLIHHSIQSQPLQIRWLMQSMCVSAFTPCVLRDLAD
jgi:hypothetical protein